MKTRLERLLPQNFNDLLALILIFLIPCLWILDGVTKFDIAPEISGALIGTWTMIITFYFRKRQGGD